MKLPWDERMRVESATSYAPTPKQLRPAVKRVWAEMWVREGIWESREKWSAPKQQTIYAQHITQNGLI